MAQKRNQYVPLFLAQSSEKLEDDDENELQFDPARTSLSPEHKAQSARCTKLGDDIFGTTSTTDSDAPSFERNVQNISTNFSVNQQSKFEKQKVKNFSRSIRQNQGNQLAHQETDDDSDNENFDNNKSSSCKRLLDESEYSLDDTSINRRNYYHNSSTNRPGTSALIRARFTNFQHQHQSNGNLISWSSSSSSYLNNNNNYYKRFYFNNRRMNNSGLKNLAFFCEKRTLAIIGAVLIHITLGTVYTLSNVNSYMTSYMRKHSEPLATYGSSIWFSSLVAVGQGFSMIFGGLIERRYSARLSCILGCTIHSLSIAATHWTIQWGFIPTLITYGLLPGIGIGLAYLTPLTNGFGWFPHRKGTVAGIILAGFGIGTFIFNIIQTNFVNPDNLSPNDGDYFDQPEVLLRVPALFTMMGLVYGTMQFIGCCLLFKPPAPSTITTYDRYIDDTKSIDSDENPIFDSEMSLSKAVKSREFWVLYCVYGITTQGVLFINAMAKEYGQIFIRDDMYLAAIGSLASVSNCLGRLFWGMAVDHFEFSSLFTLITIIFGSLVFLFPFKFILSNKILYLLCTLGIFGSFSGWMAIYPVFCTRTFGRTNAGIVYGLIFTSQSIGGVFTAIIVHKLYDEFNRYIPCICVFILEIIGLATFHLFYPKR